MTMSLRSLTLLFALYVISDFVNPALPGVFSFENDGLFVPGAVAGDPNTNRWVPTTAPFLPFGGGDHDQGISAMPPPPRVLLVRTPRRAHRTPSCSVPTAPSSPSEDH